MTKMIIFEFQPLDGKLEELIAFFEKALPETRQFPGNQGATAARQTWDEIQLVVITYWANESDMENFIAWRKEEGDYATLRHLLAGKPMIRTYDVLDIEDTQNHAEKIGISKRTASRGLVYKLDFSKARSAK